jgi:hypothetical protein
MRHLENDWKHLEEDTIVLNFAVLTEDNKDRQSVA